jgi:TctA family transporter
LSNSVQNQQQQNQNNQSLHNQQNQQQQQQQSQSNLFYHNHQSHMQQTGLQASPSGNQSNLNPFSGNIVPNFMAYNPFVSTTTSILANTVGNPAAAASSLSSLSLACQYNPVVSSVVNAVTNSATVAALAGASVVDHRTSSIASLRLKAIEHSVALGTI